MGDSANQHAVAMFAARTVKGTSCRIMVGLARDDRDVELR
jgi:hypothetical protein